MELGLGRAHLALDVVARRHAVGVEIARGLEQVPELHALVAADAGNGRGAGEIAVGKLVDHRLAEGVLVIEHVMGESHLLGDAAGVVDVAARAARALLGQCRAVVIELQRHAHHVIAFLGQLRRHDRAVDAARHGDDDPRLGGRLGEAERIERIGPVERHGAGSSWLSGGGVRRNIGKNRPIHKARAYAELKVCASGKWRHDDDGPAEPP